MRPCAHSVSFSCWLLALTAVWLPMPATLSFANEHSRRESGAGNLQTSRKGHRITWVCNAYGRESNRGTWQTVTGARMPTEAAAKSSALKECASRRTGCQPSGCWRN